MQMNERDLRSKKQSVVSIKNINQKNTNSSHIKSGPNCEPKQPPNISRAFQQNKNKDGHSKQLKYDISRELYETQKLKSKILIPNRISRPSHPKNNNDQNRVKKTKRQPHYISKPHKAKTKMNSKQNKQSRSNFDAQEMRRDKQKDKERQKMVKTQVFQDKLQFNHQLSCKQKFIKKIKRTIKPMSVDLQSKMHFSATTAPQNSLPRKTFAQQIAQFESLNPKIQISFESETLVQLFYKEQAYTKIQNYNCYLSRKQTDISWTKRAKVLNWMIQILSEMGSKREVFGLAANYIDRYLAATKNFRHQKLQTLACAAMSIANKIEGMTFSVSSFRIPGMSFTEILDYQEEMCKVLKWKLNPPTLNMWANRISQHWDMYLDHHAQNLPIGISLNLSNIRFKDSQSYLTFRTLMQYIDIVILDIQTLQYHNREVAASFIYIILNQKLNIYSREEIYRIFWCSSQYLIKQNDLNDFYSDFLQYSFGFSLQDLLPTIQYCSTFVMLPLTFQLPNGIQQQDDQQIPFSLFCSLLTYNSSNLSYLQSRNREFD